MATDGSLVDTYLEGWHGFEDGLPLVVICLAHGVFDKVHILKLAQAALQNRQSLVTHVHANTTLGVALVGYLAPFCFGNHREEYVHPKRCQNWEANFRGIHRWRGRDFTYQDFDIVEGLDLVVGKAQISEVLIHEQVLEFVSFQEVLSKIDLAKKVHSMVSHTSEKKRLAQTQSVS